MTDDGPKELRPHGHVYGNFREPTKKKHVSSGRRRAGNDEKHLAAIRELPCCICFRLGPSDSHHLKGGPAAGFGERIAFRRATDKWTVPVCRMHHELVQPVRGENELLLFRDLGLWDVYDLARSLFAAPKIQTTLLAILVAHRET